MESKRKIDMSVYTYEFMPLEARQKRLFELVTETRVEELKARKQEVLQKYLDRIASGELVPRMGNKKYRCKTLYNQGGVMIFKMENVKDETYDWDFGVARHQIGPHCHVIIDNRKDVQHIAIERKVKAFSSPNVVKNILNETLRPLLREEGLRFEINPQYHPEDFWNYIQANREYGIREVRFYFPYPNLPAISDKYGDMMKAIGVDYNCMPGLILCAPDDMDILLDPEDKQLNFWVEAASESGIPVAVQSKRRGARLYLVGKNSPVIWPIDKLMFDRLDPDPQSPRQEQMQLEFMPEDEKSCIEGQIMAFLNKGRVPSVTAVTRIENRGKPV